MINFYRRSIPGAAEVLELLNSILKSIKNSKSIIEWNNETENAFVKLKEALANATILFIQIITESARQ